MARARNWPCGLHKSEEGPHLYPQNCDLCLLGWGLMGIIDAGGGRWFEIHCVEIPILSCKCLQLCTLALDFGFGGCTRGFDIGIFCMLDLYQRVYWMINIS
jgi:hypothetical protein